MHARSLFLTCSSALLLGCGGGGGGALPDASGPLPDAWMALDAPSDAGPIATFDLQFVDPDHGPFRGNTEVLVRGVGFDENTQVRFGGRAVEPLDMTFIDSRRIVVRTPPGDPGPADIEVQSGDDIASLTGGFRYEAIAVDPPTGSVAGGTFITITGFGTDFGPNTSVMLDGLELTGVQILGDQLLTGHTPPNTAGSADVRIITATSVFEAERGFTYQTTGDPFFGGMSGGPIDGTVNVVVLDSTTDNGVPGAYVVIGDPATSPYQGTTDFLGQITFSAPGLGGPITLSAAAEGYELASFVEYDAENLTIFLRRPPDPFNGPPPPAPQIGRILGHVLFGDATTIGSPYWDLVPEPRTATERKRLYVTTASRNMFGSPYPPTRFIDYIYDPDVIAWEFDVWARPSATAVVAVAGLYDPALDPSGTGSTGFQPFAMGVTRGILVGPGEAVIGVDLVVDIPLDSALRVELNAPPPLDTPGWNGPSYYRIRPLIDLGGEGAVLMNKHGMPTPPPPEERPNYYRVAPGSDNVTITNIAALASAVADSSYGVLVGAYTETDAAPYSARVVRGISDLSTPVVVGDFLGTPRPVDPLPSEVGSRLGMSFEAEAGTTGQATFNMHTLLSSEGDQLARVFTRGDVFDVTIPDMTLVGLPPFPTGVDVNWYIWSIKIAGGETFDQFTYRHLSSLYWESYASTSAWVQFPVQ